MVDSAPATLEGLVIEACEWLPSGADSGLLRVRGRWTIDPPGADLPELWLRAAGAAHGYDSLPDTRFARGPGVWRGTYVVPARLMAEPPEELWLAWAGGVRVALPRPVSAWEPPASPASEPAAERDEGVGGELIDHAVLADRRARRAEASEREQARVAAEALRALEVLELRSTELERRLEDLQRERDELAAQSPAAPAPRAGTDPAASAGGRPDADPTPGMPPDVAAARAAAATAEQRVAHSREALAAALGAAARARGQAREWRLHLRTAELVRTGEAVRLAVLEAESAAARGLREELAGERRERAAQAAAFAAERERAERTLAAAREETAEAAAELQRARMELDVRLAEAAAAHEATRGELTALHRALGDLRSELEAAQREADAAGELQRRLAELDAALAEERRALAVAHTGLETARAELVAAESLRRAEGVARATLDDQLDRERAAREALAAALDAQRPAPPPAEPQLMELRARVSTLEAELEAARAEAATHAAAVEAARADAATLEADVARMAVLEADLAEERRRRAALEQELEASRAAADREAGSLTARIAELDRRAAGLAGELELRARNQAEAAARIARPEARQVKRVAADLDAAAASLRERVPAPDEDEAAPPEEAPAARLADRAAAAKGAGDPPAGGAAEEPPVELPPAEGTAQEPPVEAPPREDLAQEPPVGHRLRGALARLAREDPVTAGRILAALLPAQAAVLRGAADYDLTIREVGTFAVTIAGGRAWVKPISTPRGRRGAEFHVSADARSLAELLAGAEPRLRRFAGPQRLSGRRRRVRPILSALANARLSLPEAARAGARLDADLLMPALPHAIDPAWTRGHTFTIEHRIGGSSWFVVARDAGGVSVTRAAPDRAPDAVVSVSAEGFQRLVRAEAAPAGQRPVVRGDRVAVALLKGWMDRAQGLDPA